MRPIVYGHDTPRSVDAFDVDWSRAVEAHAAIDLGDHAYLESIGRYANIAPLSLGIAAHRLSLSPDPELARLLSLVHAVGSLAPELVARLFSRSSLAEALHAFAPTGGPSAPDDEGRRGPRPVDRAALEERVRAARFRWLDPFLLEGSLARYLYFYGMYRYFHQEHDAATALAHTRALLHGVLRSPLESIVALETELPWGDWFDPHSCTDRSVLLLDRDTREGALLVFSHSD